MITTAEPIAVIGKRLTSAIKSADVVTVAGYTIGTANVSRSCASAKSGRSEMKQINVPVEDEVYEAAKLLAAKAGMLLKAWVARAILNQAAKERNDGNS
jgi:hypothetical protein